MTLLKKSLSAQFVLPSLVFFLVILSGCSSAPPLPQVQYGKKQPINNPEWVKERQTLYNQEVASRAAKVTVPQDEQMAIYKANLSAKSIEDTALFVPPDLDKKKAEIDDLIAAAKDAKPVSVPEKKVEKKRHSKKVKK